ncbi:MAG: hypothetical protein O3B01_17715 [Planctomycetota bacterium]|nr:hypothetical protein [Planctomycetota bacterium]MDA1140412.1 hypothetical protein [Planctomycetota bacterium]
MTTPDRIRKPFPLDSTLPLISSRGFETEELPESPDEFVRANLILQAIKSGDYKVDEKLSRAIEKMLEEESF